MVKHLVVVMACASAARAQPATCLPKDVEGRGVAAGAAVLCTPGEKRCWSIAEGGAFKSGAPPPPPRAAPIAEVRDDGGKLSTCFAGKCKPLGKKLAAAITKAKAEHVGGTTDLAAVLFGDLWSVANDHPIKLKYPRTGDPKFDGQGLQLRVFADVVLGSRHPCAAPCAEAFLFDSAGRRHGEAVPAGPVVALDAKRAAMFPADADNKLTLIDLHAHAYGDQLELPIDATMMTMWAARVDDETLVALTSEGGGDNAQLLWVHAPKAGKPKVGASVKIEACP